MPMAGACGVLTLLSGQSLEAAAASQGFPRALAACSPRKLHMGERSHESQGLAAAAAYGRAGLRGVTELSFACSPLNCISFC